MLGIVNYSPSLLIIDLIANKKINKKKKLKRFFLKGKASEAIEKRIKINISSNLIKLNRGKFIMKKNGKKVIVFLNLFKKIYGLKSDAQA